MKYYLIGSLLGSLITSQHDTQEACEGRAAMLKQKGAMVQCVENKSNITLNWNNGVILTPNCGAITCNN